MYTENYTLGTFSIEIDVPDCNHTASPQAKSNDVGIRF